MARRPASDAYSREFPTLPGERRLRGIVGAIVGAIAGALGALWRIPNVDWTHAALGAAFSALVFGLLARWLGDAFWRKWIWWLRI
jgi:hypothetical protein